MRTSDHRLSAQFDAARTTSPRLRVRRLGGALLGALLLAVVTSPLVACSELSCTLLGCSSNATGILDLSGKPEEFDGRRIEVCRNGACQTSPMRAVDNSLYVQSSFDCEVSDVTPDGFRLHVHYLPLDTEPLAVGDSFTMRVTDASFEKTFAQSSGTIRTYRDWHPNGEACDGDYSCRAATIE